jgi:signal transduction histidine kinase
MLGRQQIAGIPTAISELFKNAHDAYAETASVDFFRSDGLFVLRDDGVGMTEDDFLTRWLTLGTESKASDNGTLPDLPRRDGYRKREILGEKGIGRLAIAAIGPQTLVLSRPLRDGVLGDVLVSFLHWGLFELPSANLDEIEIPVFTYRGDKLPSVDDVKTLVDWVEENLLAIALDSDKRLVKKIRNDLRMFRELSLEQLEPVLGSPSLATGSGTQFYILPTSETLLDELQAGDRNEVTPLHKALVGFANTMTPGHPKPALQTFFRDHFTEDASNDIIQYGEFFTPDEFTSADHHIRGHFDAFGQFKGTVSIYGGEPIDYEVAWVESRGAKTECGAFDFSLAYVQGNQRDSRLDPPLFVEISDKLNRFGGLYIYRDGIRVLPYGNTDFDFLDIEVRRAKSASDWFFSYRRMFGVIDLTRRTNSGLREKAGREGFADNKAYRQFRHILMNFMNKVAVDFFRDTGSMSEPFWTQRAEFERLDRARKKRQQQIRGKRSDFTSELETFFSALEEGVPGNIAEGIIAQVQGQVVSARKQSQPEEAARLLIRAENGARAAMRELIRQFTVTRPRGIGLTRAQARDWAAYENEHSRLTAEVVSPTLGTIEAIIGEATHDNHEVNRRLRFEAAIDSAAKESKSLTYKRGRELKELARDARHNVDQLTRKFSSEIEVLAERILSETARLNVSKLGDSEFVTERSRLEEEVLEEAERVGAVMETIAMQLSNIEYPLVDGDGSITQIDIVEALETDLEELRERAEEDLDLVQLGTAIQVINHEFDSTINSMRRSLRRIKGWADANPDLENAYKDLRVSFDHLDGYLHLFTPLNRRLHREKVEIVGSEIYQFLLNVFERRLADSGVSLVATNAFEEHRLLQYPSTIYPVFVNVVDNAIWWLSDYRGERRVELDAKSGLMIIRDDGPGIRARDRDAIFEPGFSRKPAGTGYGLFISQQVLSREGMSLELSAQKSNRGAEFVIRENESTL